MKPHILFASLLFLLPLRLPAESDVSDLYHQRCQKCHGERGDGHGNAAKLFKGVAIADFNDPQWKKEVTDKRIIHQIEQGDWVMTNNGRMRMKPFDKKLSDEEIAWLVKYVRSFEKGKATLELPPKEKPKPPAYWLERAEVSAQAKSKYKRHCLKCHGKEGNGEGKAAKLFPRFEVADFRDSAWQEKHSDEAIFEAIKFGAHEPKAVVRKKMNAYDGKLSDREIADQVALIRSWKK